MKTLQVNIGLNNNPYTSEDVIDRMASDKNYRLMAYQIVDMEYLGNIEPTFVGLFEYKYARQSKILTDFEDLASEMTQDSIAISTDKMDAMAFSPRYTGEPYKFDEKLFKRINIKTWR
jgi:hypothetical protein